VVDQTLDSPTVAATVHRATVRDFAFTLIVVFINLLTDLAYTALDPRVRTS